MDDLLDEMHSSSDNERNFDNLLELEDKPVPQPASSSADGGNPNPLDSSPRQGRSYASPRAGALRYIEIWQRMPIKSVERAILICDWTRLQT